MAAKLAAVVQVGAQLRSIYAWAGKMESTCEIPISIKTSQDLVPEVTK